VRPGVVVSFDPNANAVVVNIGTPDAPVNTHSVPLFTHAGSAKSWRPMKAGQQVTLLCPDGDLSNAIALPGGFHDKNPAPSSSAAEDIELQRGNGRVRATDTAQFIEFGGASVKVEDGAITLKAPKIILDGTYYLGGADAANPVAMLGTVDTGGNADVTNLSTSGFTK
jgi:phage baseplate assembly protein V